MKQTAAPNAFTNIAAADRIIAANRTTLEACQKRANSARKAVRCAIELSAR